MVGFCWKAEGVAYLGIGCWDGVEDRDTPAVLAIGVLYLDTDEVGRMMLPCKPPPVLN